MAYHTISEMIGLTMVSATGAQDDEEMVFTADDGRTFTFYHSQDCCEYVSISDVIGDLSDLVGSPIVQAELVSSDDEPAPGPHESYTWTFYKFATVKGSVTVRWLGSSNGYYSESVDFRVDFPTPSR